MNSEGEEVLPGQDDPWKPAAFLWRGRLNLQWSMEKNSNWNFRLKKLEKKRANWTQSKSSKEVLKKRVDVNEIDTENSKKISETKS